MKLLKSLIVGSLIVMPVSGVAKTVKLNTAKSTLQWTGSKVLVDSEHTGKISIKNGQIEFASNKPVSGEIVVDMNSIVNEDLKDPTYNKKLVGHLKSNDFFATDKHPEATLRMKAFEKAGKNMFNVKGDITIRGITKPIEFKAQTSSLSTNLITADLEFDRTDFNVRYNSGKFFDVKKLGDKVIADKIQLKANIVLESQVNLGSL